MKAADESNADVGDKANDAIRVNGRQLRAKVVGEGGNLGLTQRGRIEYAHGGGRIYTDFIDNSAGVDCSDHEVNIKILLGDAVADGTLSMPDRDALLAEMTDEVGALVLRDNYEQAAALGNARAQTRSLLPVHRRLISELERTGRLDRALEAMPSDEELAVRADAGRGLTAPEFAVLLAYVKIDLEYEIVSSTLPDDPWTAEVLSDYFPTPLRDKYGDRMAGSRAAPADHHDATRQRSGQPGRHDVRVPGDRGDRRDGRRRHPGVRGRARRVRSGRVVAGGRGSRLRS